MDNNIYSEIARQFVENDFKTTTVTGPETETHSGPTIDTTAIDVTPLHMPIQQYQQPRHITYAPKKDIASFKYLVVSAAASGTPKGKKPISKPSFTIQEQELKHYQQYFGIENTQNIHGIDDDLSRDIFEFLLEKEAVRKFKEGHILYELTVATFNGQNISACLKNGILYWDLGWHIHGTGFLNFKKTAFNLSQAQARATLASVLGMRESFLYSTKGHLQRTAVTNGKRNFENIIPNIIDTTQGALRYIDKTDIYGHARQLIGAIVRYKFGDTTICLPASVVGGYLSIALHQPSAYLLNQADIDSNHSATIIYCQDLRTAIVLDKAAKESSAITSADIIITGSLGLDLTEVPWSYLENHNVVFITAQNKESYEHLESYKHLITRAGAKSFKIYPYWLLHSEKPKLEGDEPDLAQKARYIGNIERISVVVQEIIDEAMEFKNFITWGQDIGLFVIPSNPNQKPTLDIPASSISCQNMANVTGATRDHSEPVTIDEFCAPNFTSLFWGASDVGKSWFAINFCIGIILGLGVFFLAPPKHKRGKHKVAYADGEIGAVNVKPRIEQLCNALNISHDEVMPHFDIIDLNGKSLLDENVQNEILILSRDNNWKTLVVDNVQACAPEAPKGRSNDFFQFIAQIKSLGVNIILIHHATKEKGTHRGDGQLEDLSNCILKLQTASHDANLPDGAVITEVIVQKCKVDGNNFKNKSSKYMLPIGGTWEFLDGDLPNYHNLGQVHHEETLPDEYLEIKEESIGDEKFEVLVQALPPKEEELFNFVKSNKKITRQMVQDAFKIESRTAGNWLKNLVDKGLIIMHCTPGSKNAYYTVAK